MTEQMTWWQFLAPAIGIALIARFEAMLIGPYWSWLEMTAWHGEYGIADRRRRQSFYRRVAIPGVVCFVIVALWPTAYDLKNAAIVAAGGAGLILWPVVFQGLPTQLRAWAACLLYLSMVAAFASAGLLGAYVAVFARDGGGVWHFIQDNVFGVMIGALGTLFFTGAMGRVSRTESKRNS